MFGPSVIITRTVSGCMKERSFPLLERAFDPSHFESSPYYDAFPPACFIRP